MTTTAPQGVGARLTVRDVTVQFAGLVALAQVDFVAEPGKIHALIGPNGAGKSTLFNVLCGIYRPLHGSVRLDDRELIGLPAHRIARLGVGRGFQNASMFAGLTVEESLLLGRHRLTGGGVFSTGLRLPPARREEDRSRTRVREVATFLDIEHLLPRAATELAYGLQKQVDVARALCTDPRIILLDEPAAGMHTHEKKQMREAIRRIAVELGVTVLLVEHDMDLVMRIADHVTVLDFGTVIASAPPSEIRHDDRVIEAYLGRSRQKQAEAPQNVADTHEVTN